MSEDAGRDRIGGGEAREVLWKRLVTLEAAVAKAVRASDWYEVGIGVVGDRCHL